MSREYEQDKSNTFKAADDTHRTNQPNVSSPILKKHNFLHFFKYCQILTNLSL